MKRYLALWAVLAGYAACSPAPGGDIEAEKWQHVASPAQGKAAEPYLFTDKNGALYLSWVEQHNDSAFLRYSIWQEEQWSPPVELAGGKNWFVNWADYPVLCSDAEGHLLAHYLEKSDSARFTYDIRLLSSADSGASWTTGALLNNDGVKAEHGFVSMQPYNDQFMLSWLDGRNTAVAGETGEAHHDGHQGQMTLRGALLDTNGKKMNEWELDPRVCDCCQTSIAITDNGPVVVYRNRSEDEIRDIAMVRYVKGGWTAASTIYNDNWKIAGCPVNGPRADAIGNHLGIAWFTMAGNQSEVKVIFSDDGGASFGQPIRIDEGKAIGRVDLLMLNAKSAVVSWMEAADIKLAQVYSDGRKTKSTIVATSSESRSSGFPQLARQGKRLIMAWTDGSAGTIKLASIPFQDGSGTTE